MWLCVNYEPIRVTVSTFLAASILSFMDSSASRDLRSVYCNTVRQGKYQDTCNLTNELNKFQRIKGIMIKKTKYVPNGI